MRDNEAVSTPTNTALNFIVQPLGTQIKPQGVTKIIIKKIIKQQNVYQNKALKQRYFCLN